MNKKYDFIIIGGGSSGIVAASQIISKLNATVLIIEEGPSDWHPLIKIPAGVINFLEKEKFVKHYKTIPQNQLNGRSHYITQASILGGGSSINGMVYMRGRPSDYDEWSNSTKEKNWSYQSMLPYFKLVEDNNRLFDENHGTGGDLKVSDSRDTCELTKIYVETMQAMGHPYNPDFNSGNQRGVGYMQFTIDQGVRCSVTKAFLSNNKFKKFLTISTKSKATKIIFKNDKAIGVEFYKNKIKNTVFTNNEIILTAGSFNSPKLLMLSGIGNEQELKKHSIEKVFISEGVGQNLQDHHEVSVISKTKPGYGYFGQDKGLKMLKNIFQYLLFKEGPAATIGCDGCTFLNPDKTIKDYSEEPSIKLYCVPKVQLDKNVKDIGQFEGITLNSVLMRPKSRGEIKLKSSDPHDMPLLNPNYLNHEDDKRLQISAFKYSREILNTKPLNDIVINEVFPGEKVKTDEDILNHCKKSIKTNWHPVGTCKMGTNEDINAVCDTNLRVKGVKGLRIFDASSFPNLVAGNTNAPVIAFALKAVTELINEY